MVIDKVYSNISYMKNNHPCCPLSDSERRFFDCLNLIIKVKDDYFNPTNFRISINNAIQTLRTITFVLQKCSSSLVGFENWYSPWRQRMKEDEILRWLVEARNKIVKQGDLETYSRARATVVESWIASPTIEIDVNPLDSTQKIAEKVRQKIKNKEIFKVGLLRIERRWVDALLPKDEILESLAHGYSVMQSLLIDAHANLLKNKSPINCDFFKNFCTDSNRLPPCLIAQDWDRTMWFELESGDRLEIDTISTPITKLKDEDIIAHYPDLKKFTNKPDTFTTLEDRAKELFEQAKMILRTDGFHISMAFLGFPDGHSTFHTLFMENRAAKHLMYRKLAVEVNKSGANSFILIGEVWIGVGNDTKLTRLGIEGSDIREALHVVAADNTGKIFRCQTFFSKDDKGAVSFFNESCEYIPWMNWLVPIFEAWGIFPDQKASTKIISCEKVEPHSKEPCLCGSGIIFEDCCSNKYSKIQEAFKIARNELKNENKQSALEFCGRSQLYDR
jgi:hypothetical protein